MAFIILLMHDRRVMFSAVMMGILFIGPEACDSDDWKQGDRW